MKHWVGEVLSWLGESLSTDGRALLDLYGKWLQEEALPAGALGPGEAARIEERHLADSLAFAAGLAPDVPAVLDIGSGAGLPGIPLAILRPNAEFVLLDRSGGRSELAARAIRVLGLDNATAHQGAVESWTERFPGVVSRASLPPRALYPLLGSLLAGGGNAVIGLSRKEGGYGASKANSESALYGLVAEVIEVPVLDSPSWLLRITRRDQST